jgi:predicted ATPase
LHQLADYHAEQGETAQALPYAWRQVELDPLDEVGCRQLMRLLAAGDRRRQALSQFERLRVLLAQELAVAPAAETIALRDHIRRDGHLPAQRSARRDNLPALLTPLVGRRGELAELLAQCSDPDCRLLTILGPGGSGKTRLALEVARASRGHFTHGVCFVPLNPLQSADALLPTLVEALNLPRREGQDHQALLSDYLREKQLLLVLDGCEHLLAGAGVLAELLHQAPGLKLLVTSRTRLNLKGEQLYPLSGLRYPQETTCETEILEADAVQLLISSLRRARPEYQPEPADLKHLLQVCQQVQGMPLAILLAASWGATMSLAEITAEVSRGLDFLEADWADVPARQRSLRATYDHTWALLSERQQDIFQSLSVFRGAFSRAAVRAVSGASPHELRALVERSLLWNNTPGWYEVHELLRQYGRQQLARSTELEKEVCHRHSAYYLAQLARLGAELKSARQPTALHSIDLEHENYRAAWNWAAQQGDAAQLDQALEPLCLYYELRLRYPEAESACLTTSESLSQQETDVQAFLLRVRLLVWQSRFTRLLGKHQQARSQREVCQSLLEQSSLPSADSRFEQALLSFESGESTFQSDLVNARSHYLHSLTLFQALQQPWWALRALLGMVACDNHLGDFEAAQAGLEQCLASLSAHGDSRSLANALEWKAYLHVRRGELHQAMQSMQQAASLYRSIGDRFNIAESLSGLGKILGWHGRYQESIDSLVESLPIYQELGCCFSAAITNTTIGMMHTLMGHYKAAQAWICQGLAQAREGGFRRVAAAALLAQGWVTLGQGDYRRAVAILQDSVEEYRQVKLLDELAWALAALGQAKLAQGETGEGLAQIHESLQIGKEIGAALGISQALGPCALWVGGQGDPARAVALYTLASQHPAMANSRWFDDVYGRSIAALSEQLAAEVVAAAQARGRSMDLWQTAAGLLEELSKEISHADLKSPIPAVR